MMRRSALRRFTPLARTALRTYGALPHRSTKRAKQEREYTRLRAAFLEGRPVCELCEEAPATDCHHKRGRVGRDYLDVSTFAALCRACHSFAHERPLEAIRLGISEPRIGRAAG